MTATLSAELERLVGLSEKATAGTWQCCGHDRGGCVCGAVWSIEADVMLASTHPEVGEEADLAPDQVNDPKEVAANAAYIAAACNFIRQHKAELLGLVERVDELLVQLGRVSLRCYEAEQRAERVERDARRYRWLRGEGFERPATIWAHTWPGGVPIVHTDLDEAIDAALAARGEIDK